MKSPRAAAVAAGLLGASGVLLGAFGAHGLKARLAPEALAVFETGVRYQMVHALALLATAWLLDRAPSPPARAAGRFLLAGVLMFSGSVYLLATRDITGLAGVRWLGPVTPLGGICLAAGWVCLALAARRLPPGPGPSR